MATPKENNMFRQGTDGQCKVARGPFFAVGQHITKGFGVSPDQLRNAFAMKDALATNDSIIYDMSPNRPNGKLTKAV